MLGDGGHPTMNPHPTSASPVTQHWWYQALAPIADMREDTSPSAERRRTAYTEALIRRHPEADEAEAAWDAESDEAGEGSEVFERGPAVDVIAAVEAVLGRSPHTRRPTGHPCGRQVACRRGTDRLPAEAGPHGRCPLEHHQRGSPLTMAP